MPKKKTALVALFVALGLIFVTGITFIVVWQVGGFDSSNSSEVSSKTKYNKPEKEHILNLVDSMMKTCGKFESLGLDSGRYFDIPSSSYNTMNLYFVDTSGFYRLTIESVTFKYKHNGVRETGKVDVSGTVDKADNLLCDELYVGRYDVVRNGKILADNR